MVAVQTVTLFQFVYSMYQNNHNVFFCNFRQHLRIVIFTVFAGYPWSMVWESHYKTVKKYDLCLTYV